MDQLARHSQRDRRRVDPEVPSQRPAGVVLAESVGAQ
jgi:hypothetical protein